MSKIDDNVLTSLHASTQHIVKMYRLIRANPKELKANSLLEYSKLIENLLQQFFVLLPKSCVPIAAFKKVEKDNVEMADMISCCINEQKTFEIELNVLHEKLKESQGREKKFELQISSLNKDVQYYRSQSKSMKKSGEQSIKQIMAVVDGKIEKEKYARHSLPNLGRKQKLSILWLMNPKADSKLVNHLMNKS